MGVRYCEAQSRFIKKTRAEIDRHGAKYFDSHDWERIEPKGGRNSALTSQVSSDSFYVKAMAVWAPELLFPNHVPACPRCETSRYVDVNGARWVNFPKILHGVDSHRYLDTKLYPCSQCNRRFTGYNRQSMALNSDLLMGFFNYYLSSRFAVDDQLHTLITACWDMSTPTIHRIIEQSTTAKYLRDETYYLHAARAKRVKARPASLQKGDKRQSTLDPVLTDVSNNQRSPNERTLLDLQQQRKRKRLAMLSAEGTARDTLCFKKLWKVKKGRNNRGSYLKAIGIKKLDELMEAGIMNARQLLETEDPPECFSDTWLKRKAWVELILRPQHSITSRISHMTGVAGNA